MKKTLFKFTLCILPLLSFSVFANEGLNLDLAILKINKEIKTLNNEILSLKDEIEILRENQRINSEKINELLQMIELNRANSDETVKSTLTSQSNKSAKLFSDGKNSFVLGNYEKSIKLFLAYLETSPSSSSVIDTKLWLGRAYFFNESFIESKEAYLEYQIIGQDHAKFADSLYELSKVYIKLNEINKAKLLLSKMTIDYSSHSLSNKATELLNSL
jgi:TolA-binding protein